MSDDAERPVEPQAPTPQELTAERQRQEAERQRAEDAATDRQHRRTALRVLAALPVALLLLWFFSRGLQVLLEPRVEGVVTPPSTSTTYVGGVAAQRGAMPSATATCSLAIGDAQQGPAPTRQAVTLPVGAAVVVVARCSTGVQVVDLVVSTAPPDGVLGAVPTQRLGDGSWARGMEIPAELAGAMLAIYGYADGRPAGAPVTLTVSG
ncbi:MAG: hypothetical protein Q8R28_04140 [Dehalococcoidia bacterium]|nr:hypothetical protein [Dehalococcoidia bacterium]